ncbi:MAG: VWA domain-containing protein [Candidatus Hydrogenedentes bacterium]|nr:VWA domain-containing protein [Candidatus Hydrogenedentota bacterium]
MTETEEALGFGPRKNNGEPVRLAMQELHLSGKVLPVGARLMLQHVFVSGELDPIEVVYAFALPRDAALRQFHVTGEGFRVRSELKPVEEAEKAYEDGIEAGSLSTLAKIHQDGVVNLAVGNIRPGETVAVQLELVAGVNARDDGYRFRFPFALAPGYHPKARMVETQPGTGEIELPEEFGDVILPAWTAEMEGLHHVSFDLEIPMMSSLEVSSPSHPISVRRLNGESDRVTLATEGDVPNRDLVLDVRTETSEAMSFAGTDGGGRTNFITLMPSALFGERREEPRRVVFVIDRSGSMDGAPMRQALAAVNACLGALTPEDRFGIVAFDDKVESTGSSLLAGDAKGREIAQGFLPTVHARGGTELAAGIEAAAKIIWPEQDADILLVTDGQVMGIDPILFRARRAGLRVHCLGIGSASQDRFLTQLARETGGTSQFLTPRERVDMAAVELFSTMGRPMASGVAYEVQGAEDAQLALRPSGTVHAGNPAIVYGSYQSGTTPTLCATWNSGSLTIPLSSVRCDLGETVKLVQGARLITDADARFGQSSSGGILGRRMRTREEQHLEKLSREYGLASRRMALVAVVERPGDTSGQLPATQVVPVGMPEGTSYGSYFPSSVSSFASASALRSHGSGLFTVGSASSVSSFSSPHASEAMEAFDEPTADDRLVALAGAIAPDGGMPGRTPDQRVLATVLALTLFVLNGHTAARGIFAPHVRRLLLFLRARDSAQQNREQTEIIERVVDAAKGGSALAGSSDSILEEWDGKSDPDPSMWKRMREVL